jgi:hypothetical protein
LPGPILIIEDDPGQVLRSGGLVLDLEKHRGTQEGREVS